MLNLDRAERSSGIVYYCECRSSGAMHPICEHPICECCECECECEFQYCECRLSGAMHPIRIEHSGRPVLGVWGVVYIQLFVNVVTVNVNVCIPILRMSLVWGDASYRIEHFGRPVLGGNIYLNICECCLSGANIL